MDLYELKEGYLKYKEQLELLENILHIKILAKEIGELNIKAESPDLWKNNKRAQKVLKDLNKKKNIFDKYKRLKLHIESALEMIDYLEKDFDEDTFNEMVEEYGNFKKEFTQFKIASTFTDENDDKNAIMTIKPGAGGTEAQDWALMLLRMYTRWAERKGYDVKTLEFQTGEEAGIKIATILISGDYVYGLLKGETGIHRLVRISPFDANKRRHTSFASVYIIPEVDDSIEIEINPKDLKIDTFHSSGPGGQSVNTSDSAVRITHIPTGIVATCQVERSQVKNKEIAMKLLRARLYEHYKKRKEEELEKSKAEKKDISWGHQIRSYVFHPYNMVKDLRTNIETSNTNEVMDGDIDIFIEGYLMQGENR